MNTYASVTLARVDPSALPQDQIAEAIEAAPYAVYPAEEELWVTPTCVAVLPDAVLAEILEAALSKLDPATQAEAYEAANSLLHGAPA